MLLKREPVRWTAFVAALLNTAVLLGWVELDTDQLASINVAVAAFFALVVQRAVTPNGSIGTEHDGEA